MSAVDPLGGASLTLAVPLPLLAEIAAGDVLEATVLPPVAGQDLLEILGQTVTAQLPAGVYPGEKLTLEVTGFSGNQIFVQNVSTADPATLVADPLPVIAAPAPASAPVAPSSAVFVAAAVLRVPAPPSPAPAARPVASLDARIAAAQTTRLLASAATPQAPPQIHQPALVGRPATVPLRAVPLPPGPQGLLAALRVPATPVAVAAARIASHAIATLPKVFARLDTLLQRASQASRSGQDPRVATLRTMLAFVSRLEPGNARAFSQQLSAFVANVLEGGERRLGELLRAHLDSDVPRTAAMTQQVATPRSATSAATSRLPVADTNDAPVVPAITQAKIAVRGAALDHDVKSLVLSLLHRPPASSSPALTQALNETLATITGAQLTTLAANTDASNTIALSLPVLYYEGGQPAQIRVTRDAPSRKAPLDSDTFHVAFVLDTATLGTVAIDLDTVGRQVKISVKTEHPRAADRFTTTLTDLQSRLEHLRYRVASMTASVAAPPAVQPSSPSPIASAPRDAAFDMQA